jgi:UDP-hydrolysing UDP-N-acetyl-D-glucosamine 2-epimerase
VGGARAAAGPPLTPPRRICAFSGKRGGFGAYLPLMRLVEEDPDLELLVLLGDMHAAEAFGATAGEVRRALPSSRIELIDMGAGRGDTPLVRAENLAVCLRAAATVLERERPDIVLVHGDRGEHLMVAYAALTLGLAVAHTQGGDRSGNVDEIQRHAITKLAHLHFPETEEAARRIEKLGEDDWRIHVVGSTYVDRIVGGFYTSSSEARRQVGLGADEPFLLAVVHPETYRSNDENRLLARETFDGIQSSGLRTVVTFPCSDPGYEGILETLRTLDPRRFIVRPNIDNDVYLGLMSTAEALVGNSSAALVEAPYLRLPAVNVGDRQQGRERDGNVLDAGVSWRSVADAIAQVRSTGFREALAPTERLGDGRAAERIVEVLRSVALDRRLLEKQLAY